MYALPYFIIKENENMVADFRSKLNFEPKQIQFIEKVYNLKTDHKTGLLLQELFKRERTQKQMKK